MLRIFSAGILLNMRIMLFLTASAVSFGGLNGQQNLYQATVQGAIDHSATDLNRVFLELQSVLNLLRQPLFAELFP